MARTKSTIRYPRTNTFTLADIVGLNEGISTQTVRKHVRTATYDGTLRVTGRKPSCGRGRPCFVYEKGLSGRVRTNSALLASNSGAEKILIGGGG